ncbi:MAG: MFS transporter [Chloroflexi bacterium]|nr:MFS transporter [Chloroflexota bacterium]
MTAGPVTSADADSGRNTPTGVATPTRPGGPPANGAPPAGTSGPPANGAPPGRPGGHGGGPPGGPGGQKPSFRRTFSAFKYPKYRLLWISMAVGMTGMQMQMIAQGLLAYELSGTFTAVGVLAMAWGVPQFFFALPGGAIADRMDKRTILLITQVGVAAQAIFIGLAITTGVISLPMLFIVGVFMGATFSFNMPARQAFIPEVVPREQMMNAIALNNTAMNSTRIFSPLAAGLFISLWGFDVTYYITGAMYGIGWLTVILLPRSTAHLNREKRGMFDDIAIGLRYVRDTRALRVLMFMAFVPILLGIPYVTILPAFARADLGQGEFGFSLLVGLSAVGALIGSLVIATLNPRSKLPLIQSLLGAGWGAGLVFLGLGSAMFGFPGALAAMFLLGVFQMGYMALNNSMLMLTAAPEYHGRVMSLYMLTFGIFPLMGGPLGVLGDAIGGFATFTALGAALVGFIALMAVVGGQRITMSPARRAKSSHDGIAEAEAEVEAAA